MICEPMLTVPDDSGFLAVVVPSTYGSFVGSDWEFDQLMDHFRRQMSRGSLLIVGTGLEGKWRVGVGLGGCSEQGFREVVGALQVVGGSVLVTNYESLTMAAEFDDVRLPEPHEKHQVVELPDGTYGCRVVQMFDPEQEDSAGEGSVDFMLEFVQTSNLTAPLRDIPWFERG
jgi:hypothetical protein